eukprot:c8161_g1_i1.p1 GENE.c8161_g1_i1~~c8161_g1_i1.p1  ORF type:complete len:375 (-),score=104.63 c8161_g1_i1:49-1173(-)
MNTRDNKKEVFDKSKKSFTNLKKKPNQKVSSSFIRSFFQLRKENEFLKWTLQATSGSILNSEEIETFSKQKGKVVVIEEEEQPQPQQKVKVQWKKFLHKKQPFPDNYVPDSFLESLITNEGVYPYKYWPLVRGTSVLIQQICCVVIFMVMFSLLYDGAISAKNLLVVEFISSAAAYGFGSRYGVYSKSVPDFSLILRLAVLFGILLAASPVLHTLTYTISTDTIFALVICLLFVHIGWADYSLAKESSQKLGALSVNSGLFVSVLLASRLPSPFHGTSLICFAVGIFGFFPIFRKKLNQNNTVYLKFTLFMFFLTCFLLCFVSFKLLLLFTLVIGFLTFVCPLWLQYMQRYKFLISGPWDEALPTLRGPTSFKH